MFIDDMEVVKGPGQYNWAKVDSSWDYMLSCGVTPIVELSYMPAYLANCSWDTYNASIAPSVTEAEAP